MALINCPECGNEISDTVKKCIHCGYKLDLKKCLVIDGRIVKNKFRENISKCIYWQKTNDEIRSHEHKAYYDEDIDKIVVFDNNTEFETIDYNNDSAFQVFGWYNDDLFLYYYYDDDVSTVFQISEPLASILNIKIYEKCINNKRKFISVNYELIDDSIDKLFIKYTDVKNKYSYSTYDCTLCLNGTNTECKCYCNDYTKQIIFFQKNSGKIENIYKTDIKNLENQKLDEIKKENVLEMDPNINDIVKITFKSNDDCSRLYKSILFTMSEMVNTEISQEIKKANEIKNIKALAFARAIMITFVLHFVIAIIFSIDSFFVSLLIDGVIYGIIYSYYKKEYSKKNKIDNKNYSVVSNIEGTKYINDKNIGIIVDNDRFVINILTNDDNEPIKIDFKDLVSSSIIENDYNKIRPSSLLYTHSVITNNKQGEDVTKEFKEVVNYCDSLVVRIMTKDLSNNVKPYDITLINSHVLKSLSEYQDNLKLAQTIDTVIKGIVDNVN